MRHPAVHRIAIGRQRPGHILASVGLVVACAVVAIFVVFLVLLACLNVSAEADEQGELAREEHRRRAQGGAAAPS